MAAAAEKRLQSEDSRGMKDPEGYKRKLEQREKAEQQANLRNNDNDAPLKVRDIYLLIASNMFCKECMDILTNYVVMGERIHRGG